MTTSLPMRVANTLYMAYHRLGQAHYPYRPLAEVLAERDRRVRRIVAYAYRHVPYYRETLRRLGLTAGDFHTFDDLTKLPILERAQLQRAPQYFTSTAQPLAQYHAVQNSGTTGRPCTFYLDAHALLLDAAYGERGRAPLTPLLGRSFGYRLTMIATGQGGTSFRVQRDLAALTLLPRGVNLQRQHLSVFDPPEVNAPLINAFKPDVLQGFGSYIGELFMYLKTSGAPMHLPKAIRYTSDPLPDPARRVIEEEFGVPVFSRYEVSECPSIGFECEQHHGLHLNVDLCPLRVVDGEGRTLPAGESGEVVISNLINRGTVLLNYRLGDLATLLPDPCPCGRMLPLLSPPQGRRDEWLTMPSGRRMHPQTVIAVLRFAPGLWQYQITQLTPALLNVAVVADNSLDRAAFVAQVQREMPAALGEAVEVQVQFAQCIPRTPGGKVRTVMSWTR